MKAKLENSQTGNQLYLTTYRWDREGNKLEELRYNHGQTTNGSNNERLEEVVEETLPDAGKNVPNGNAWGWWKKHGNGNNGNGNNGNGNGNNNGGSTGGSGTGNGTPVPGTYQYEYDAAYRLIWTMEPNKVETDYTYDSPVNLVSAVNYADGQTAAFVYNGTGELVELEDWTGTTTFTRDLLNRLTEMEDHDGRTVGYEYDPVGNQTQVTYLHNLRIYKLQTPPWSNEPRGRLKFVKECPWAVI